MGNAPSKTIHLYTWSWPKGWEAIEYIFRIGTVMPQGTFQPPPPCIFCSLSQMVLPTDKYVIHSCNYHQSFTQNPIFFEIVSLTKMGWKHTPGLYLAINGHEFEQALEVGDGQGSLVCCGPWGHKESDTAEQVTHTQTDPHTYTLDSSIYWVGLKFAQTFP